MIIDFKFKNYMSFADECDFMTNIGLQSIIRKQKIAGIPRNLIYFQKIRIQRWRPLSRNC